MAETDWTKHLWDRCRRLKKATCLSRTVAAAVVGGTTSEIAGGKFANGAVTGQWSVCSQCGSGNSGHALTADEQKPFKHLLMPIILMEQVSLV